MERDSRAWPTPERGAASPVGLPEPPQGLAPGTNADSAPAGSEGELPAPAAGQTLVRERPAPLAPWPAERATRRFPSGRALRGLAASHLGRHLALLAGFLAAGVALTWPRASYLSGRLPALRDTGGYVWGFWWIAHQATHLANPWFTSLQAAPVGTDLAYHTLMPLPGLLFTPVTLLFGPSASYNLLAIACPGLLCYAMYRAARLWLPSRFDAVAAGLFFGLSATLAWRSWYQVNLALGAVFLPLTLEASVRLRRSPGRRQAVVLGAVLGAALLTDQESAVLAAILAMLALASWLLWRPSWGKLRTAVLAGAVAMLTAGPQIAAMIQQSLAGAAATPAAVLARNYNGSGAALVQMFGPSPRLAGYGLDNLASLYYQGRTSLVITGYGMALTVLALIGLITAWRRPAARLLALLWLGASAFALGSEPWLFDRSYLPLAGWWHGVRLSLLMPYTWFARLPGLANFREADRFTELGLLAAALLAGAAVGWLRTHARPILISALALGLLEAGWSGNPRNHQPIGVMPTALPALDRPIAADHSGSVVVDVPFGIRGGLPLVGAAFPPETLVLATADGHPLANAYVSRIPHGTIAGILQYPFYRGLLNAQGGPQTATPASLRLAAADARALHIGWVLVWVNNRAVVRYLRLTGFRLAYRADRVSVYRRVVSGGHRPVLTGRPAVPPR